MTLPTGRPPDGWTYRVQAGWIDDDEDGPGGQIEPEHVPVGKVMIPAAFVLVVQAPAAAWAVWLQYSVSDKGEITVKRAAAAGVDLPGALDALRAAWPLPEWTRVAVVRLVVDSVEMQVGREAWDTWPGGNADPHQHMEWFWKLEGVPRMDAARRVANALPYRKRRNRVTHEHLRQVAEVYKAAAAEGLPTTEAVCEAFQTTPSTAARWVGLARTELDGVMPPPTRGVKKNTGARTSKKRR